MIAALGRRPRSTTPMPSGGACRWRRREIQTSSLGGSRAQPLENAVELVADRVQAVALLLRAISIRDAQQRALLADQVFDAPEHLHRLWKLRAGLQRGLEL